MKFYQAPLDIARKFGDAPYIQHTIICGIINFDQADSSSAVAVRNDSNIPARNTSMCLKSQIFNLQSAPADRFFNLQSSIFNLQSSIFNLQSSIFNLQSSIFNLKFPIPNPLIP